jgi:hypothetical protein
MGPTRGSSAGTLLEVFQGNNVFTVGCHFFGTFLVGTRKVLQELRFAERAWEQKQLNRALFCSIFKKYECLQEKLCTGIF